MTKEKFAAMLNGREYRSEITKEEEKKARQLGLLVVYGYSDDNVEFSGIIQDEFGAWNGTKLAVHRDGVLEDHEECECKYCGWKSLAEKCATIEAVWDGKLCPWTFKTKLPHATFDIMENGELFCRGIVIDAQDIPAVK